jgi:NAD(P)-dependent dehydrogenase (short-subunit alcohol dehydrogenase family)
MPKPLDVDMREKVVVITGANSGIGKAATAALSALGAHVVMVCRDPERAASAQADILSQHPAAQLSVAIIDLSDLDSVRVGATKLRQQVPAIDVLINNAAIWLPNRQTTPTGTEMMWATNVLGPFLLTELLMPSLYAATPSRIINLTSVLARNLDLDDPEFVDRPYTYFSAYGQSKQANRMWTWDLAQRHADAGVVANAVHPGGVGTNLGQHHNKLFRAAFDFWGKCFARTPQKGADTVVWLAACAEGATHSGEYWVDRRRQACPHRDPDAITRLREMCALATGG